MATAKQIVKKIGGGKVAVAARKLGCSRQALYNWMAPGAKVPELYLYRYKALQAAQDSASATNAPESRVG